MFLDEPTEAHGNTTGKGFDSTGKWHLPSANDGGATGLVGVALAARGQRALNG